MGQVVNVEQAIGAIVGLFFLWLGTLKYLGSMLVKRIEVVEVEQKEIKENYISRFEKLQESIQSVLLKVSEAKHSTMNELQKINGIREMDKDKARENYVSIEFCRLMRDTGGCKDES